MPSTLGKNLHLCFTKLKRPKTTQSSRTPLIEKDHNRSSITTTSSSSVLLKNFNSLYDLTPDSTSKSLSLTSDDFSSSDSDYESTTPDFATVFASQRFFFSSPGRSNSIIEPPPECQSESDTLLGGCVPIPTYSPDPYMDFRRSMQEMIEARNLSDVTADWDYLHEMLLCYLTLNPKYAHKFIIGAFSDLLVGLMTSSPESDCRKSDISGNCTVSPRLL